MSEANPRLEKERQAVEAVQGKGLFAKLGTYTKLSGPGWLQSAITLGGGSLAGSLYLGSVGGYDMMWLQPLMMIFGIVMLSAIGYVALSTERSPFHEMNKHVSPVLGWGWAIATLMANLVWAMPQFSLGTAAMQQNLGILPEGENGRVIGAVILFVIGVSIIWFYNSGGKGIKVFEGLLKVMVGVVVLSFFAVVAAMTFSENGLPWGDIFNGFVPKPELINEPSSSLAPLIAESSNEQYWTKEFVSRQRDVMVAAAATAVGINMTFLLPFSMLKRGWNRKMRGLATFDLSTGLFIPFVLATSCVVIAAASQFHGEPEPGLIGEGPRTKNTVKLEAAYKGNLDGILLEVEKQKAGGAFGEMTAEAIVGGNMIQPVLAQTYTEKADLDDLLKDPKVAFDKYKEIVAKTKMMTLTEVQKAHDDAVAAEKKKLLESHEVEKVEEMHLADANLGLGVGPLDAARDALKIQDKRLAATLIKRDAFALADSLENLAGKGIAQIVFGIGVLGMAISTIIILMLINGFTICEMLGKPSAGMLHRFGCILPGITGALGMLYLWGSKAQFYLAVPTSKFGMVLLPIAYIAFFFMMNSRKVLGDQIPTGGKRLVINVLMLIAVALAVVGASLSLYGETKFIPNTEIQIRHAAVGLLVALVVLGVVVHFVRGSKKSDA